MPKLLKRLAELGVGCLGHFKNFRERGKSRKKLLWSIGLLTGGLMVLLIIFSSLASRAEYSLAELKESWQREKICHEDCALWRRAKVALIVDDLRTSPGSGLEEKIKEYFLSPDSSLDFKNELVRIVALAAGDSNPPSFLKEYLEDGGGQAVVKAKILISFAPEAWLSKDAREESPLAYYFDILSNSQDVILQKAAIRAISNLPEKRGRLALSDIQVIKDIIFDSGSDLNVRRDLIMLLGDYYALFPKEAAAILTAFYKADPSGDNLARAFAADILNRLAKTKLVVPEVSPGEWASYYGH